MKSKFWLLLILSCLIACFIGLPLLKGVSAQDAKSEPSKDTSNERPFITQNEDGFAINPENDKDDDSKSSFGFTKEQTEKLKETEEKFEFQTEVSRLMKLIINSLYKTREIFLRELISNASDAIDKIRFLSLTDPSALKANSHLNITIWADPVNKVLTITDSGIGMTRKQLKENLGTIAKSGTSEFLNALEDKKADMNLIGQFGVGFYSVFLVADKVVVTTKHNDDDQYVWESQAINDFTIAKDPRGNTLGRGTQIKLHFKDDATSFLEDDSIRNLILKYSEFINFPIWLWTKRSETIPIDDTDEEKIVDDLKDDSEEPKIEDAPEDDKKSEPKTKTIEIPGWELMNTQKPIWTRDPKNVTDIEYENFYTSFSKDSNPPLSWTHFKAEGEVDFKAIVYIPSRAPDNLFQKVQDFARNVKLFVKRVFITDEFLDFVPKYLAFIKAIIDADDLPLNVSRETLQQHRALQLIKKRIVKKTLELIADLKNNDEEKYNKFLKEFGTSLKVGAIEDNDNRKKIAHLLKFPSSYKGSNWTSIDDYIIRMKKDQDKMYFVTGSSVEEVEKSPFIEGFVARGYEVLYMVEPIDEMLVQHMPGHGGKMFQNIAKGNIEFDKEDFEKTSKLKFKFIKLTEWMQTILTDQVEKITISSRLTTSPCAVVANEWGWTGNMEKIMAAQPFKQENEFLREFYAKQKKILEINPHHPLILGLLDKVEKDQTDENISELVIVLYESTLIRSGYVLKDNLKYAERVERILRKNLGINLDAKPEINIVPAEDADPNEKKSSKIKENDDLFKELDSDDDFSDPTKPSFHDEL
ncbi:heat shock protein Hsp90 [Gigaspora margarita]|uniref:Heat shock protein Hsp90 n=1 Tax=Gigaspora margarita TaxID=4874 RepID=A0A8H4ENY4_GIGMA|nr:heat shock protein Hsp90 [Gigaspora margarita]